MPQPTIHPPRGTFAVVAHDIYEYFKDHRDGVDLVSAEDVVTLLTGALCPQEYAYPDRPDRERFLQLLAGFPLGWRPVYKMLDTLEFSVIKEGVSHSCEVSVKERGDPKLSELAFEFINFVRRRYSKKTVEEKVLLERLLIWDAYGKLREVSQAYDEDLVGEVWRCYGKKTTVDKLGYRRDVLRDPGKNIVSRFLSERRIRADWNGLDLIKTVLGYVKES